MQPASSTGSGSGGNRNLKRWGPIVGVVAVVAIGAGIVIATSGDDDKKGADTTLPVSVAPTTPETTPTSGGTTPGTSGTTPPSGEITFPLSYDQAKAQGIEGQVDWGDRCDTTTGNVAVPDFFAADCYAPFTGDNGGATSPGVTADEITIVVYLGQAGDPIIKYITDAIAVDDTNAQIADTMTGLMDFYQAYYELYGRKINLITYEGTGNASDEVAARADAAQIAEEYTPFVVLGGPALTSAFADELSARKVMCIGCTPGQTPEWYAERSPYVWGLDGSAAQKQEHVVEFITKQLVGKNAEHAGDEFTGSPRKFGLVYLNSSGASEELANRFATSMSDAGAPLAEVIPYVLDPSSIQQTAVQVITKLKASGITTVIFSGDPVAPRDFTTEATAQEYFPEWVVAASTLMDTNAFARTYDQQQWAHAFGVTQLAAKADATKIGAFAVYKWFTGQDPPAPGYIGVIQPNPALFFAVVESVGPNLTPEAFRDALFAGEPTTRAIGQPSLSYGDKGIWPETDYLGVDDATVFFWDPTATGPDEIRKEGTGMYRFPDGGKRYLPGEWPTEDKLFQNDGTVTIYTTPPPGEEPKDYPSPAGGS